MSFFELAFRFYFQYATSPRSIMSATSTTPTTHEPETTIISTVKSNASTAGRVHGFKLAILLGSLTLVTFLSLLDMAIIGTACYINVQSRYR